MLLQTKERAPQPIPDMQMFPTALLLCFLVTNRRQEKKITDIRRYSPTLTEWKWLKENCFVKHSAWLSLFVEADMKNYVVSLQ